mmetsp:Transcript_42591/g.43159  ORF Transcript_42591/g.43159 Transcript_42591/m.43159 type:complete len:321 (-) Transcript_42591:212-1174(-)
MRSFIQLLWLLQGTSSFTLSRQKGSRKVTRVNNIVNGLAFFTPSSAIAATPFLDSGSLTDTTSFITALDIAGIEIDAGVIAGSFLWGLNLYFGFDWLLAPLNLDNDFNPAARTTVAIGRLLDGQSIQDAAKPIVDTDGERPELGTRIGTGANLAYAIEVDDDKPRDWLSDREAGLSSDAPFLLQISVVLIYLTFGIIAQLLTNSALTSGVLAILACVYEIGRPSLPTREEAVLDAKLDKAVAEFADDRLLKYGEDAPVRQDEAVNERELVVAFRKTTGYSDSEASDFQIEMRMRSYGTGRSVAGFIKGLRLVETGSKSKE